MATLVETHVSLEVKLTIDTNGQKHAFVSGQSLDAAGTKLRSIDTTEVTAVLNPTQQQEAIDLLTAAEAYLKNLWSIS